MKLVEELPGRRAYRRPISAREIQNLLKVAALAKNPGEPFEEGIRLAVQAILVSPHFLYRIERDPKPGDVSATHPIMDYELASRLSYFLWSSMPDAELFRLAGKGELRKPQVLDNLYRMASSWSSGFRQPKELSPLCRLRSPQSCSLLPHTAINSW